MTTAFAPLEALSGWLRTSAILNPLTYVLEGMRAAPEHLLLGHPIALAQPFADAVGKAFIESYQALPPVAGFHSTMAFTCWTTLLP